MIGFIKSSSTVGVILVILAIVSLFIVPRHNPIPATLVLQVPFTAQAPTNNWDRNEDCEETSITMVNAYLNGQSQNTMSASDAQNAINQLKNWEQVNIGYNADTGAAATTRMAQGAFNIKVRQIKNFTQADLKRALADNHPVLLPHDARKLGSPKYANGGPDYHMLVIRGYDETGFIVNDPGTSEGNGNVYTFETLWNAAADWNQVKMAMEPESKIALVLSK